MLTQENVPEVAVANNVERYSLSTMYQMRGCAYTEYEHFLEAGKKNLAKVKKYLKDAKALGASSAHLAKLKEAAEKAELGALEYEKMADETVKLTQGLEAERKSAEVAAKKYMDICDEYLKGQHKELAEEIKAGTDADAFLQRVKKSTSPMKSLIWGTGSSSAPGNPSSAGIQNPSRIPGSSLIK